MRHSLWWPSLWWLLASVVWCVCSCSSRSVLGERGVPEPVRVLENPDSGERVRFFAENPLKVPADYDEQAVLAMWTAEQRQAGFTREIPPADDRAEWAQTRRKSRAAVAPSGDDE